MSELSLAIYQPDDQESFARLVEDVHAEFGFEYNAELDTDLAEPESHYALIVVVKSGSEVVGSAALTEARAGVATLKRMYLRPSLRGHGWGRRLLEEVTERAVRDGCEQIQLDTTTRQIGALRLYKKSGFKLIRQNGEALVYSKELRPST